MRVLVAAPHGDLHRHLIEEWLEMTRRLSHPHDVFLVYTGKDEEYATYLASILVGEDDNISIGTQEWSDYAFERLARARETIRQKAIDGRYDYIFWLDTDTFVPADSIEKLVSHGKDIVSIPCYVGSEERNNRRLCIWHLDELANLVWEDEKEFLSKKGLVEIFGGPMSPCLMKRKVFDSIPFRFYGDIKGMPRAGEDTLYHIEANSKGFKEHMDLSIGIADHRHKDWDLGEKR